MSLYCTYHLVCICHCIVHITLCVHVTVLYISPCVYMSLYCTYHLACTYHLVCTCHCILHITLRVHITLPVHVTVLYIYILCMYVHITYVCRCTYVHIHITLHVSLSCLCFLMVCRTLPNHRCSKLHRVSMAKPSPSLCTHYQCHGGKRIPQYSSRRGSCTFLPCCVHGAAHLDAFGMSTLTLLVSSSL